MVLKRWLHYMQGMVRVRVEAAFPERVMNLMGSNGISFWQVQWESQTAFSCVLSRRDSRLLRHLTQEQSCTVTVLRRQGVPYLAREAKRRRALAVTLIVTLTLLFFGSFCIWDIEIEGETALSEEEILRVLAQHGVKVGAFAGKIDSERLRNEILPQLSELSWLAVNVRGFRAYVQVRARVHAPKVATEGETVNLVARRDAVVRKIEPLWGEAVVLVGSTVREGELLISGISDRGGQEVELLAAVGRVEGRTWYTLTTKMPLTVEQKCPTGETKTTLSLTLGQRTIKIFGNSRYPTQQYDKITGRTKWELFGLLPLPVTTVRETLRFYQTETVTLSAQAQREAGAELLEEYLRELLEASQGEIVAKLVSAEQSQGWLRVTLRAECLEQIARAVPTVQED